MKGAGYFQLNGVYNYPSINCTHTHIYIFPPGKFWKNDAIWCILKCILIYKFQGKNSLKISVCIATTTKKVTSNQSSMRSVSHTLLTCAYIRGVTRVNLVISTTLRSIQVTHSLYVHIMWIGINGQTFIH